ncbi:hypothetical protein JK185_09765 [Gluconobacter wancherniae]|uniref:Rap1a/Tai family immunity protein n=1 Tax=Gluconobacter wancherniae TaxID=1307955 RepID=UPI001B8AEF39|nr:Rap1a/Tai family immunity protein [Gluconobacter wancherniae]MBS1063328.1 hypothetical protein [Gluconobacter wancherniae]
MIRFAAALALTTLIATPALTGTAHAQRVSKLSGKALGAMCSSKNGVIGCDAYIAGIMDSAVWSKEYDIYAKDSSAPVAFCVPETQSTQQVRGVIVAWLHANTDAMTQPAGKAVYRALHENYACHASVEQKK